MKYIVAHTGKLDAQGDIILPGAIKNKEALLTREFDLTHPIAKVNITEELAEDKRSGIVFAEFDPPADMKDFYPALSFRVLKSVNENEVRIITEMHVGSISLTPSPNVDPNIKKLSDQG